MLFVFDREVLILDVERVVALFLLPQELKVEQFLFDWVQSINIDGRAVRHLTLRLHHHLGLVLLSQQVGRRLIQRHQCTRLHI